MAGTLYENQRLEGVSMRLLDKSLLEYRDKDISLKDYDVFDQIRHSVDVFEELSLKDKYDVYAFSFRVNEEYFDNKKLCYFEPLTWDYINTETEYLINESDVTEEIVEYWIARFEELEDDLARFRFADLILHFGQKLSIKLNFKYYAEQIHSSLVDIVRLKNFDYIHTLLPKVRRTVELLNKVKLKVKINEVFEVLWEHEYKHSDDDKLGTYGYCFDIFIAENKGVLNAENETKIIVWFEAKLEKKHL